MEALEQRTREWYEYQGSFFMIGGGRALLVSEFPAQMLKRPSRLSASSAPVHEQWPLIRTLQWAAAACGQKRLQTMRRGGP